MASAVNYLVSVNDSLMCTCFNFIPDSGLETRLSAFFGLVSIIPAHVHDRVLSFIKVQCYIHKYIYNIMYNGSYLPCINYTLPSLRYIYIRLSTCIAHQYKIHSYNM